VIIEMSTLFNIVRALALWRPRHAIIVLSEPVEPFSTASGQRGRLIDAADQTLQPCCKSTPLLFREKGAQLTLPAVRLDREPARMQARSRAAKFNLSPMPRKHDLHAAGPIARLDAHVAVSHGDRLAVEAALQAGVQRPTQQHHFQAAERKNRPEAPRGQQAADGEGDEAQAGEESHGAADAQRAIGRNFDAQRGGVHDVRCYAGKQFIQGQRLTRIAVSAGWSELGTTASGGPSTALSRATFSVARSKCGSTVFATQ